MSDSALEWPHVAIVSDDLSLSHFLVEGLPYEGFWTSAIGSGLQFLEVLRLRSFDAVLLDAGLGDIPATEVIRRMRGTSDRVEEPTPRSEMAAIVVAGYVGEIDRSGVLAAGGQELLEPPFEITEVAAAVRKALDQAGRVWFTAQNANKIGRLDPRTGEIKLVSPPTAGARPYGLRINSKGIPVVVLFGTNKIATVDPQPMAITEYSLPNSASRPRRLALESALREATALPMPSLRQKGARGQTLIREKYAWEQIATRSVALYRAILQEKQNGPC